MLGRALLILSIALLAACGVTPGADRPPQTYQLGIDGIEVPRYPSTGKTLLVTRPKADPGYETRGIIYSLEPHEVNAYTRSRWADTPARMLEPALASALEQSGLFQAVLRAPVSLPADYQLISSISHLRQNFAGAGASRVELGLRLQLIALNPRSVIATRTIRTSAHAPSEDAKGAVDAAHAALAQAMRETVEFVGSTLAGQQ